MIFMMYFGRKLLTANNKNFQKFITKCRSTKEAVIEEDLISILEEFNYLRRCQANAI